MTTENFFYIPENDDELKKKIDEVRKSLDDKVTAVYLTVLVQAYVKRFYENDESTLELKEKIEELEKRNEELEQAVTEAYDACDNAYYNIDSARDSLQDVQ